VKKLLIEKLIDTYRSDIEKISSKESKAKEKPKK